MGITEFLSLHPGLLFVATALFGLTIGSFLNVVVHRLPLILERDWRAECREAAAQPVRIADDDPLSLSRPGSRCPHCGHAIRAWENIPLLSYIMLKGRCADCGGAIGRRYPVVEAVTMLLSLVVVWRFGVTATGGAALLLTWSLIALSLIDFDEQILPDAIVYPVLWLGLLLNVNGLFVSPGDAILGAAAGYLSLWMVFRLFLLVTGKHGMGHGDFKLLALFGAWLGWQLLPQIVLVSSLVGALWGGALILSGGRERAQPMPFGPFLATAGWIALLWGPAINDAYLRWSELG